ncbi:MAG TPA: hypothetical protein VH814_24535 [Steroidobacteraceae bacterium]|jgi:hypothetical protein
MKSWRPSASFVIWLIVSTIAVLSCSLLYYATQLNGESVPLGIDSFYHARRILDTVRDPSVFYQFDAKIHAPEGSLLPWPWGYDYLMARIVRVGLALGLSRDPMAILIWIPTAAVPIAIALLIVVARRLGLSTWPTALAALCLALAPTTQFLFGTGQIDHHYAEMIMVLAALAAGLSWCAAPNDRWAPVRLAAVLGIAPAIHNGLFILQVPILAVLFVRWLQGPVPARRSLLTFAVVLLAVTTAILLPSLAFREGRFEFYALSWFHGYIAACTALVAAFFGFFARSRRTLALLAFLGVLALLPILEQARLAGAFVAGTLKWLDAIAEMRSPVDAALTHDGALIVTQIYSLLIWLAPVTFLLCVVQSWRERQSERLLFWISAAAGLALLSTQIRMHYFGDYALYLPWLVLASDYVRTQPQRAKLVYLLTSLALVMFYISVLRHQLVAPIVTANDGTFKDTRSIYGTLGKVCAEDPGIVLADNNAGHYIRYYSDCSVIVDNFLLTPQDFAKMDRVAALFAGSAEQALRAAPEVKYVLVRALDIHRAEDPSKGYDYSFFFTGTPQLAIDLLLSPPERVPSQYVLIDEIRFPGADNITYARLYKIERSARSGVGE